jgi:radical SAM-linked protein
VVSTAVQRWRVTFRRPTGAPEQAHQALAAEWSERLAATGLPFAGAAAGADAGVAGVEPARPRLVFAAPLPLGMAADRELVDVELSERRQIGEVRDAISAALPEGLELVDLHDVWLGEPSLAGLARRADYLVRLEDRPRAADLQAAVASLLAAPELIRSRDKGGRTVDYDLRPLVVDVGIADPGPPIALRITTAFDPERGVGRPEDVVAALAEFLPPGGPAPGVASIERERIVLAGEA